MIEDIAIEDIPRIIEIGKLAHAESKYSHLPYSEQRVMESFLEHILDPNALAIKAVVNGKLVGFFIGYKTGMIFTDVPIGLETCYYIVPEHRGGRLFFSLMKRFTEWAGDAPQICMAHFKQDNSKTYTALEKLGFKDAGKIYTRGF